MTNVPATSLFLRIEILDYWIAGSGTADNSALDECVEKDADGFPYLPCKHIKGLLRDAMRCGEAWGWAPKGSTALLLGTSVLETTHLTPDGTDPGKLQIYDARLPERVRVELIKRPQLASALFGSAYSTAIDVLGVAKDKSLRGTQTTIPLSLEASLMVAGDPLSVSQMDMLSNVLRLICAVGKKRHRGMGRAWLTLGEDKSEAGGPA